MIELATSATEIEQCFPIVSQLRPHLNADEFVDLIQQQIALGYQLAYVTEQDLIVGIGGFQIATSLSWGKYLYVADLVVDEKYRSQGYGEQLFNWLIEYARNHNCQEFHLDSGVQRFAAHRFYLRQKMNITSHHFALKL